MDIDTKIKELQRDLERLEAELDSINRANYDGHETKTLRAKEKQIREKQSELLKYKKAKEMASIKDSMEILRLSGYTVDGPDPAEAQRLVNLHNYQTLKNVVEENMKRYKPGHPEYERLKKLSAKYDGEIKKNSKDAASNMSEAQRRLLDDVEDIKIKYKKKGEKLSHGKLLQELSRYGWEDYELTRLKLPLSLDAGPTKDSYVTWVKPSGIDYKIGDVIQFKGKEVKITKITGNVVEATVLGEAKDGCSTKDGGPGSGIKGHTTESSEESFWENKLREVAKQKGISESDIESLISQVKKGGAKAIMSQKDGYKMEDGCSTKDYDDDDETMTTAEARQYWNRYHNSDPVLKMYKSYEEWYRESKMNGYIKDAYNHSDWENEPRHKWTVASIKNELDKVRRRIDLNHRRIQDLRSMVNSKQFGSSTLRELKEEEADYQANMMKVKQLVSMMQRAQGQKDACSNKDSTIQKECNEILRLSGFITDAAIRYIVKYNSGSGYYILDTLTNKIVASQFESEEEAKQEANKLNKED